MAAEVQGANQTVVYTQQAGTGEVAGTNLVVVYRELLDTDGTISSTLEGVGSLSASARTLDTTADRTAGTWVEAWNIENTTRRIAALPVLTGGVDVQQLRRPPGGGSVTLPAGYQRLTEIFDPIGDTIPPILVGSNAIAGNNESGATKTVDLTGIGWLPGDMLVVTLGPYANYNLTNWTALTAVSGSTVTYWRTLGSTDIDQIASLELLLDKAYGLGWSVWRGHDGLAPERLYNAAGAGFYSLNTGSYPLSGGREAPVWILSARGSRGVVHSPSPIALYDTPVGINFPVDTNGSHAAAASTGSSIFVTNTAFSSVELVGIGGSSGPTRSLLKVYDSGRFQYGFFPERINRPFSDDNRPVTISGAGQESQVNWAPLPPPEWNYGYDTGYFQNFLDPPDFLTNGGYYEPLEGTFGDPTPGWSARGGAEHTPCTTCTTGQFGNVIRVNAAGVHTGIQQTVDVLPGERYKFRTWIEGSTTGQRITITMNFNGEAASGATVHTANTFVYPAGSDNVLAELENVARNPAGNGCPGGSTDGTVQYTELDVTVPADCDRLTVGIQYDTHPGCTQPANDTFYVHGAALEGIGAGMPDEFSPGGSPTVWDTGATTPISGDYSWQWQPETTDARISLVGPITVEPGDYFAQIAAYAVGGPPGEVRLLVYGGDASTVFADTGWVAGTGSLQYLDTTFTRSDAANEVYLGVGVRNSTGVYWFDEVGVFSGRAPASPGRIIGDMLAAVQSEGYLGWLTTDFTDTVDSNGELWRSTSVAANFGYGGTLMQALDRIATMGYEWTIEAEDQRSGFDTGWVLRLFNGYGTTP